LFLRKRFPELNSQSAPFPCGLRQTFTLPEEFYVNFIQYLEKAEGEIHLDGNLRQEFGTLPIREGSQNSHSIISSESEVRLEIQQQNNINEEQMDGELYFPIIVLLESKTESNVFEL
jgi:hypothetical protein